MAELQLPAQGFFGGRRIIARQLSHRPGAFCGAADFLIIILPPLCSSLIWKNSESLAKNLCFWLLLASFSLLLTASYGGYRAEQIRRQYQLAANCFLAISAGMLTLAVLLGHPNILVRHWVVLDLLATPVLLTSLRLAITPRLTMDSTRSTMVICYDSCPRDLGKALARMNLPARVAGVLYLATLREAGGWYDWPELTDLAALQTKMRGSAVTDVVVIHHPELEGFSARAIQALLEEILAYPARIWLGFDVAANLPDMLRETSGGCRLVPVVTDELLNANNLFKRLFDIAAGTVLLTMAAPLMAVCAVLVRASGPGPVIFRQLRTGAQGQAFNVLKFRTMSHDPARKFAQTTRQDPRVTKIGQFLRRSSLDELPQLVNVISGRMSLVGPRPHAPETMVEGISFESALQLYQIRHRVKPGMTGLAQIRGQRGETPMLKTLEQRLSSDLEYIRCWTIWLDISILLRTLPAVLAQKNAW